MEILPILIPVLVPLLFVGVIALIIYAFVRARKRREDLFAFATHRGWGYARTDPFGMVNLGFSLFRKGEDRGCENVMWGTHQQMAFKEADYWYYTESTDSKGHTSRSYSYLSVCLVDVGAWLPRVSISRENVFTRLADHLSFRDIEFESGEFNKEFQVKAEDRALLSSSSTRA